MIGFVKKLDILDEEIEVIGDFIQINISGDRAFGLEKTFWPNKGDEYLIYNGSRIEVLSMSINFSQNNFWLMVRGKLERIESL